LRVVLHGIAALFFVAAMLVRFSLLCRIVSSSNCLIVPSSNCRLVPHRIAGLFFVAAAMPCVDCCQAFCLYLCMLGGWTFTSAKIQKYSRTTKFMHKLFYIFLLFNKKNAAKPQSRRDIY
jgi:hypothetical protein